MRVNSSLNLQNSYLEAGIGAWRSSQLLCATFTSLLLLLGFVTPGIAQAGTAGVTNVIDTRNGAEVNPSDFRSGVQYEVKWSATENVRDIHLQKSVKTTVDVNNTQSGNQHIEIEVGSAWAYTPTSTWINLLADPGAKSGSFKITINDPNGKNPIEEKPTFTRDGQKWPPKFSTNVIPETPGAKGIPYLSYTATLDVTGATAGGTAVATVDNATPNGAVVLGYSLVGGGPVNVNAGCAVVTVSMTPPFTQINLTADANGTATFITNVPAGATGVNVWVVGFDLSSCTLTNGVQVTL